MNTTVAVSGDEAAFLSAIRANRRDDLPRLVYADWLDDHAGTAHCPLCWGLGDGPDAAQGDCPRCGGTGVVSDGKAERAEFIRAGVEMLRLGVRFAAATPGTLVVPGRADRSRLKALARRQNELLEAYGDAWAGPALTSPTHRRGGDDAPAFEWQWFRGFLYRLYAPPGLWCRHAAVIRALHPGLDEVVLDDWPNFIGDGDGSYRLTYGKTWHPLHHLSTPTVLPVRQALLRAEWPDLFFRRQHPEGGRIEERDE